MTNLSIMGKKRPSCAVAHRSPLYFQPYANGHTLAFFNAQPCAWIAKGRHKGQVDNQPYSCTFYDVAFIQTTHNTQFLDSSPEFDTEQQARAFITRHFSGVSA